MKIRLLAAALAACAAQASAQIPESMDAAAIPNYTRVRPAVATAGQPSPETLARLKELGFRTVINLRTEAEGAKAEEALVAGQGLRYVSIPVTPDTFSVDDARKVAAILEEVDAAPVLLHCHSANRVGGVWAVAEAIRGKPRAEAEAEGKTVGLRGEAMRDAVRRVLDALPARPAR